MWIYIYMRGGGGDVTLCTLSLYEIANVEIIIIITAYDPSIPHNLHAHVRLQ